MLNKLQFKQVINLFSIIIFIYYLISKSSFYFLSGQTIFCAESDNFYWLLLALNIPQFISESEILSITLDVGILSLSIYLFFRDNIYLGIILMIIWILFFIQYNLVSFHHYHDIVSVIFLSLINCFKKDMNKWIIYECLRYYFLFSFCSSALWKIFRGNIFFNDQFSNILTVQNAELFVTNTLSIQKNIILFLINNPNFSFIILLLATFLELFFIIGFFTKKKDLLLFFLIITFTLSNWLLLNIFNWKYTLFAIVLIPIYRIKKTSD